MRKDICAIWILDESANQKFNEVRGAALDVFGIEHGPIYGHITFANLIDIDVDEALQYTRKFAPLME